MTVSKPIPSICVFALLAACALPAGAADLELRATLNGSNVVSATESPATGEARAVLGDDNRVRIQLAYGGLLTSATGAALYLGRATENGAQVAELAIDTDLTGERLDDVQISLTDEAAERMRAGESYLQVDTAEYPAGAIRGQLLPQPVRLEGIVEPEAEEGVEATEEVEEIEEVEEPT